MTTLYLEHYPIGDINVKLVYVGVDKIVLEYTKYRHEIINSSIKTKVIHTMYKWTLSASGDTIIVRGYEDSSVIPCDNITIKVYMVKKQYMYKLMSIVRA